MKLYDYYRSTACYRVRIALAYKGIAYETIPTHLIEHGGEQHSAEYRQLNPQELVPSLLINDSVLTQSLAIIEYLNEIYPQQPLLPEDPIERAHVRSLSLLIACDVHPLNNLRVLQQLQQNFSATEEQTQSWYHHWLMKGFDAFENRLQSFPRNEDVCFGRSITMADLCLIPQVYNANRFDFSLKAYPLIEQINRHCLTLDAFKEASKTMP